MEGMMRRWPIVCFLLSLFALVAGCASPSAPAACVPNYIPQDLRLFLLVSNECSRRPSWSPDGSEIVFDYYAGPACPDSVTEALVRASVTGVSQKEVMRSAEIRSPEAPVWSPQGDWIAFSNNDWGGAAKGVYIIRPDGTEMTHLTSERGYPVWSPDGKWIAFTGPDGTYAVRLDGAKFQLSAPSEVPYLYTSPSWSPDGRSLAYVCKRGGESFWSGVSDLCISHMDGSDVRNLTKDTVVKGVSWPDWSPTGSRIVFIGRQGGQWDVFTVNSDGSDLINVTQSPSDEDRAMWAPNGQHIVFIDGRERQMVLVNADGSERRILTDLCCSPQDWSWSPDGQWIALSLVHTFVLGVRCRRQSGSICCVSILNLRKAVVAVVALYMA